MGIVLVLAMVMGQSVISVRAGIVNYWDGAVYIDGQPAMKKFGTFPSLHEGADLYTQGGRAELQLGPDVFVRLGTNSAVRMVSSNLADAQVQVLNGSVIFDSGNAKTPGPVTLLAGDAKIRIDVPARLRVDLDPPQLLVSKGDVKVERADGATPVRADQMMSLAGESVVRRMSAGDDDELDLWSLDRNRAIYLSLATSQGLVDPGTDPDPAAPTDLSAYLGYVPYDPGITLGGQPWIQPGYQPTYWPAYSSLYGYSRVPRTTYYGYRPGYSFAAPSLIPLAPRPPLLIRPLTPPRPMVHPIGGIHHR
jgi:hypothetical protein